MQTLESQHISTAVSAALPGTTISTSPVSINNSQGTRGVMGTTSQGTNGVMVTTSSYRGLIERRFQNEFQKESKNAEAEINRFINRYVSTSIC